MKVVITRGFVDERLGPCLEGEVIDLPSGADWVQAGLAEAIEPEPVKTAKPKPIKPKK